MEDKRAAIAVLLSIVVVWLYSNLVIAPKLQEGKRRQMEAQQQLSTPQAAPAPLTAGTQAPIAGAPAIPAAALTVPSSEEVGAAGAMTISTDLFTASISNLGGRLQSFTLSKYRRTLGADAPFNMVGNAPGVPLPLGIYTGAENDGRTAYTVDAVSTGKASVDGVYSLGADTKEFAITLRGTLPSGIGIKKTFRFASGTYLFNLETTLENTTPGAPPVMVEWSHAIVPEEVHSQTDQPGFSVLSDAKKMQHILDKDVEPGMRDLGPSAWTAYGDRYFIAALIPASAGSAAAIGKDPQTNSFTARAAGTPTGAAMNIYVGPKDYRILNKFTFELDRSIDLGMFSFLAFPLLWLIRFFNDLFGNYGLAIIVLTLLIKTLFLPLAKASFDSMQAMQQVQPEMKALRERITDPTQLNQEIMALYKRRGVNPMGGCLPSLVQLPVFLGLYNALLNSIELRHAPFALWITDLSSPERLPVFGIGIPVMAILMGASMIWQQKTTPSTLDPTQQRIMMVLPFVLTLTFISFPAGLVLYWLVNSLMTIIQQMYLRRATEVSPLKATAFASLAIFSFGFVLTLL